MSEMELFYGYFKRSHIHVKIEDTDKFYEFEEIMNCGFVEVNNQIYSFHKIKDLGQYGFSLHIPPNERDCFICYWYNGGASLHEIVKSLIEDRLKNE